MASRSMLAFEHYLSVPASRSRRRRERHRRGAILRSKNLSKGLCDVFFESLCRGEARDLKPVSSTGNLPMDVSGLERYSENTPESKPSYNIKFQPFEVDWDSLNMTVEELDDDTITIDILPIHIHPERLPLHSTPICSRPRGLREVQLAEDLPFVSLPAQVVTNLTEYSGPLQDNITKDLDYTILEAQREASSLRHAEWEGSRITYEARLLDNAIGGPEVPEVLCGESLGDFILPHVDIACKTFSVEHRLPYMRRQIKRLQDRHDLSTEAEKLIGSILDRFAPSYSIGEDFGFMCPQCGALYRAQVDQCCVCHGRDIFNAIEVHSTGSDSGNSSSECQDTSPVAAPIASTSFPQFMKYHHDADAGNAKHNIVHIDNLAKHFGTIISDIYFAPNFLLRSGLRCDNCCQSIAPDESVWLCKGCNSFLACELCLNEHQSTFKKHGRKCATSSTGRYTIEGLRKWYADFCQSKCDGISQAAKK